LEHASEPIFRFFRELVLLFGRTGAETLILGICLTIVLVVALLVYLGWEFLVFGEATLSGLARTALEVFKVFRYQPRQAHPAIRVELYIDAVLAVAFVISLIGMIAHGIIPWIREVSETHLFVVCVSSGVLFFLLGRTSVMAAIRLPRD
jgi:hypothetical protein